MRKIIFLAIAVMMALCTLSSCDTHKRAWLRNSIEVENTQCPYNLGTMGEITAMQYDPELNDVYLYIEYSGEDVNFDAMMHNNELAKHNLLLGLASESFIRTLELITDAGAGVTVDYKSTQSDKSLKVIISNDELRCHLYRC